MNIFRFYGLTAGMFAAVVVLSSCTTSPDPIKDSAEVQAELQRIFIVNEGQVGHLTFLLNIENNYYDYLAEQGQKAMAVAYDRGGRYTWGYAIGGNAVSSALQYCKDFRKQKRIEGECKLLAKNQKLVLEKY